MAFLGDCVLNNFLLGDSPCGSLTTPTYLALADFDGDDYASNGLTSRTDDLSINRGFEPAYGRPSPGTATLRLRNNDSRFSPRKTTGEYYPNIIPGRKIDTWRKDSGGTYRAQYTGFLRQPLVDPSPQVLRATFTAHDLLGRLSRTKISTPLYEDYRSDELIDAILTLAGWTGSTSLEVGAKTFPYASWRKVSALDAIQQVIDSELGLFFIAADGTPTFHNRYYRVLNTTATATLSNAMHGLQAWLDQDDIFNEALITVHPRTVGSVGVLWTWDETPFLLAASDSITLEAEYSDPDTGIICEGDAVVTPVVTTDYTANSLSDGSGTDKSSLLGVTFTAYGQHAEITLTNNDTGVIYITLAQVRGTPVVQQDPVTVRAVNEDSQDTYNIIRTFELDQPLETSADTARDAANYIVTAFGEPVDRIALELKPENNTYRNAIANVDLDDILTITQSNVGLSSQKFFVYGIQHQVTEHANFHRATYQAQSAPAYDLIILDDAGQSFADLLGY